MLLTASLKAEESASIPGSGLKISKPPHWYFQKGSADTLIDIVRLYPGQKKLKAARVYIRRVKQGKARLPHFATLIADSVRKQRMSTVERKIETDHPFFHYSYLFHYKPLSGSGERALWLNVRLFPLRKYFYIYYAAAWSRQELKETEYIFHSITPESRK